MRQKCNFYSYSLCCDKQAKPISVACNDYFCELPKQRKYRCFFSPLSGIVITRLLVVTCWDYLHTRCCHFILLRPMACLIQALFICSHRSPFLTHSTLMAPFTPLSARSPGSTMNTSLLPCLPDRLLSVEKPTVCGKPFVSYLRGGWMASSFDLYLAIFPLTLDISRSRGGTAIFKVWGL